MSALILPYRGVTPRIAAGVFIAPNAAIIGDVTIAAGASVWFSCTIRGDVNRIDIGARSNIQDGTVIHASYRKAPTVIGADVLVGHMATLHACTIEDGGFVGMGAIVLDEAVVETGALVAAGALIAPGKRVTRGQLWAGRPARYVRDVTEEEAAFNRWSIDHYRQLADEYRRLLDAGSD